MQKASFGYFLNEANPANGLIKDKTADGSPFSIAAVGMALTAYPIGVERGFMTRAQAVERVLTTASKAKHATPPAIRGFITTSSTWRRAGGRRAVFLAG